MHSLKSFYFALVRPKTPENIGASARALSVMGFAHLILIDPRCDHLSEGALRLAAHAHPLLEQAHVYRNLEDLAVDPAIVFVGLSARKRELGPSLCSLPELPSRLDNAKKVVIVFGPEESGLTNQELSLCHWHCFIPTFNPQYSSLNLSQSVQVVAYALAQYFGGQSTFQNELVQEDVSEHSLQALDSLLHDLIGVLSKKTGFLEKTSPERTLLRLSLLMRRSVQNPAELKFLMGFLKALAKGGTL